MNLHWIALILAIVAITCRISWASTQCKTIVMDVHMKKCRASRSRRGSERFDLQKYDEKFKYDGKSRKQQDPAYSYVDDSAFHGAPQKRQLSSGQVGDIGPPIALRVINGAAETGYYDPGPSLEEPTFARPGYYPPAHYPLGMSASSFRVPDYNDDLGFDLNDEELDELYNIYERQPRGSKEEAWKVFLETASKCCQNVEKCMKETTYIPCLA